ncbi:MAG: endonuclease dU [Myxococcales bacterium]
MPRPEARLAVLRRAGPIHVGGHFVYQVHGAEPRETAAALARLTDTGHVPEALRLAHLVGGALAYGENGRRA